KRGTRSLTTPAMGVLLGSVLPLLPPRHDPRSSSAAAAMAACSSRRWAVKGTAFRSTNAPAGAGASAPCFTPTTRRHACTAHCPRETLVATHDAAAHAPATELPVRLAWAGLHFPATGERQDHGGEKNKAISRCVLHRAPPWVRARRENHRGSASCFLRSRGRAGTSRGRESASRGVIVKGGDRRAGLRPNFCIDGGDCA